MSRSASSMTTTCQPPRTGRASRRSDDLAHLVDADRQPRGHDRADVGMGAGADGAAALALPAADVVVALALQRGGQRPRGDRATGAGRAGEQPGVRHQPLARPVARRTRSAAAARRRTAVSRPSRPARRGRPTRSLAGRRMRGVRRATRRPARHGGVAAGGAEASAASRPHRVRLRRSRRRGGGRRARCSAWARPRRASGTPRGPARGSPTTRARACRPRPRPRARARPSAAGRSSSTVRSGRRSSVAQRDTRRTSSSDELPTGTPGRPATSRRTDR